MATGSVSMCILHIYGIRIIVYISRDAVTAEFFFRRNVQSRYLIQHSRYECCRPDNSN